MVSAIDSSFIGAGAINKASFKTALDTAASEITALQANVATLAGYFSTPATGRSQLNAVGYADTPLGGCRNLLINANPIINQRGYVSGTNTSTANQYTLDRWRVVTSGQNITWTDSAGVRTVTAPAGGVEQVIEGVNNLGGAHVLSWTGTATATVNGLPIANGETVTLTGGANVTVRFISGTFSRPQFEPGSVVTLFERRPIAQELLFCQRYTEVVRWAVQGEASGVGIGSGSAIAYAATKRSSPSITSIGTILNVNTNAFNVLNIAIYGAFGQAVSGGAGTFALVVDLLISAEL